jgi:STE24 endopeptidase
VKCRTVRNVFLLLLAISLVAAGAIRAQQSSSPSQSATAPATPAPPSGQVQGYTLSPAQEAQAVAYARARHELYFFDFAYGVLVLILLLLWRVAPAFRDIAARVGSGNFVQTLVFSPLLLLTIDILSLPTAIWSHRLAAKYQISIQGWGSWFGDWAKAEAITVPIGMLVIWILYAAIRESPRRWWFYFWLVTIPLVILGAVAEPLVEPWFYKFQPLANAQPQLAERIEGMTVRAGVQIPEDRIFEMMASAKLKALNAYVTGLGGTKRVVVWDTTIRRMTGDEVLFVTGHEMGHYVLGHIFQGILFSCAVLLLFLFLSFRLLHGMLARWGGTWAIRGPDDLASLPMFLLLLSLFNFLFTPAANGFSRHMEHQADQYGLEVIHGLIPDAPVVAAHAFQVLGEVDLEEPNPSTAVKYWFYNHPPLDERMRFAQTYDPWSQGRAPEFVTGAGSTLSPPK